MPILRLAFRIALRNRVRFLATAIGVGLTLTAYMLLRVVIAHYAVNDSVARRDRLIVRHRNSIFFPLYVAEAARVAKLPGVRDVSWMCWFAGTYIDEKHNFTQLAVDGLSYFRMYPEFVVPASQMKDWLADPTGAIVGEALVKQHGWKIGDRIAIKGTIYPGDWNLTLRGVYQGAAPQTDRERLFMHWKYLNDALPGANHVQRILVQADDTAIGARIDAYFANSGTPTKTESELEVYRQWASWSSDVVRAISAASVVVLLVLGLILGNSMALAARESTREYAVMRAIGYRPRHIVALISSQAVLTVCAGSALALSVLPSVLETLSTLLTDELGATWRLKTNVTTLVMTIVMSLGLGLLASAWPAMKVTRRSIVDGLQRLP